MTAKQCDGMSKNGRRCSQKVRTPIILGKTPVYLCGGHQPTYSLCLDSENYGIVHGRHGWEIHFEYSREFVIRFQLPKMLPALLKLQGIRLWSEECSAILASAEQEANA